MRILFVVLNFAPEPTGTGKFTGEFARYLQEQGHEVRVVCTPPYYPWWKVPAPYSFRRFQSEICDGIKLLRCPVYVPARPTGIRRIFHLVSAGISFLPSALWSARFKADLVFNVQPTLTTSLTAALIAKFHGVPLWLHVQDLEVAAAEKLHMIPRGLRKISSKAEKLIHSRCEGLSTISPAMQAQLQQRGARQKPALFPNWVDTASIHPQDGSAYRSELGISEDTIVALYSGNMGEKQGLEIVVNAARNINAARVLFILAGDGASRQRLEALAQGMPNVRFLPLQPAERMSEFLALGDIHLVPQKAGFGDCVMPSKMTAILAAGRPCVVTAMPDDELAEIADSCGISVLPDDLAGFTNAIRTLAQHPDIRKKCGENARMYALENLSAESILPRMEAYGKNIAGIPDTAPVFCEA